MDDGAVEDPGVDAGTGVEADVEMFFRRSRPFCDMYSNTDRGADGSGVSPNNSPRYRGFDLVRWGMK